MRFVCPPLYFRHRIVFISSYLFSIEFLSLSLFLFVFHFTVKKKKKRNESNRNIVLSSSIIAHQLSRTEGENGSGSKWQYALCPMPRCENKYREIRHVQIFGFIPRYIRSNTPYSYCRASFVTPPPFILSLNRSRQSGSKIS